MPLSGLTSPRRRPGSRPVLTWIPAFAGMTLLFFISPLFAALTVQDALIAKDVIARQPVEPANEFTQDVGRLVFWTKITSDVLPINVIHVWYYQGREIFRMPLTLKTQVWRTWSRKTIYPHQIGAWKAAVQDESGKVLAETTFNIVEAVKKEAAPAAP